MEKTRAPTDPSTLEAAFKDQAQRTDGACHSSRRCKAVGKGMPMTKPSGAISPAVMAIFKGRGSPTRAVSREEKITASKEASSATHPSALMRRPSLLPSTRRLRALPNPLETSIEKITPVRAKGGG